MGAYASMPKGDIPDITLTQEGYEWVTTRRTRRFELFAEDEAVECAFVWPDFVSPILAKHRKQANPGEAMIVAIRRVDGGFEVASPYYATPQEPRKLAERFATYQEAEQAFTAQVEIHFSVWMD